MIRLQDRDIKILDDIGTSQIMLYSQIRKLHFTTYDACIKRVGALQREKLIYGTFYNTNEKVFTLTKEGSKVLKDLLGVEYKLATYENIYHKLMRTELYTEAKQYGIIEWQNEALVRDINKIFDVSYEHQDKLYLVEVHNEQKTIVLKEKLVSCLDIPFPFTLVIYCKNKNIINNLISKMDSKGFKDKRKFGLIITEYGSKFEMVV